MLRVWGVSVWGTGFGRGGGGGGGAGGQSLGVDGFVFALKFMGSGFASFLCNPRTNRVLLSI